MVIFQIFKKLFKKISTHFLAPSFTLSPKGYNLMKGKHYNKCYPTSFVAYKGSLPNRCYLLHSLFSLPIYLPTLNLSLDKIIYM